MFQPTRAICRLCEISLDPEQVHELRVPLFERSYEVCGECRRSFLANDRELAPFQPGFRADRAFRWIGPLASDAKLVLDKGSFEPSERELARQLADAAAKAEDLGLDDLARRVDKAKSESLPLLFGVYAHATAGRALADLERPLASGKLAAPAAPRGDRRARLEAARSAYLFHLSFQLRDELDARVASLHALATLELGDVAAADAKLREYRRQADAKPALRDPRLPLFQAVVRALDGNLAAVDDALKTGLAWAQADARWREVEEVLLFDHYARAVDGERWVVAKDTLKKLVKLRPNDLRVVFDLAHTFLRCDLDPAAREVLASLHARQPRDEDALLLYATCLSRLGETREAWALLRDDLETDRDDERLGAERRHLAALVAHAEGHDERARELLALAWRRAPTDARARSNLVVLVQEAIDEKLDELSPENFGELADFVRAHADVLLAEYGVALAVIEAFCARELRDEFRAAPDFGLELFDKVRFRDAEGSMLQAWRFLAQRKLGDGVRKARESHAAGGPALPVALVLKLLDRVRSWPKEERERTFPPPPQSGGGSGRGP